MREDGVSVLSILIVIFITVLVLIGAHEVISQQYFQYRKWQAKVVSKIESREYFQGWIDSVDVSNELWGRSVGLEERCLFQVGDDAIRDESVIYLSKECYPKAEVDVVYFRKNMAIDEVFSDVVIKDRFMKSSDSLRVDSHRVELADAWYVTIYADYQRYDYRIPVLSEYVSDTDYYVFSARRSDGFYAVLEGFLWKLSKSGTIKNMGWVGKVREEMVLLDRISRDGGNIYILLIRDLKRFMGGLDVMEIRMAEEGVSVSSHSVSYNSQGSSGDFVVLEQSDIGVLLEKVQSNTKTLLAFTWQAEAMWGVDVEWEQSNEYFCGIGQEVFMPILNYSVGCQKKR